MLFSPIIILVMTQATALLFGKYLGTQVYIPIILIYGLTLAMILYKYGRGKYQKLA